MTTPIPPEQQLQQPYAHQPYRHPQPSYVQPQPPSGRPQQPYGQPQAPYGRPEPTYAQPHFPSAPVLPATTPFLRQRWPFLVGGLTLGIVVGLAAGLIIGSAAGRRNTDTTPTAAPAPAAATTTATAAQPVTPAEASADQTAFLSLLRKVGLNLPDDQALTIGHSICSELDNNVPVKQALKDEEQSNKGLTPYQSGEVLGAAVIGLCPKYRPQLDTITGGN